MKRIAVVGAIIDSPRTSQKLFNDTVSTFKGIVKGRMGIPFDDENIAVISMTLIGELDEINALTGRLGSIPNTTVKTAISGNLKPSA